MTLQSIVLRLRAALWFVPACCAVVAAVLAPLLARLDALFGADSGILYAGGPDSARQMLGVVASSVLTFAGLTFSITIVALQLASSQFSPRVLRSFLRDRWTQWAMGVFIGTFVFALLTLREVRGSDAGGGAFVPGLGVTVTLVLGLASIAALMGFIHHIAQSIRVVTVLGQIVGETATALDRWYPDEPRMRTSVGLADPAPGPRRLVASPRTGVLNWYDRDGFVRHATDDDLTIELLPAAGSYVVRGQALLRVTGHGELDERRLLSEVGFGAEREIGMDPAFGLRQLVDIAERALSPGVNDPTTAVQCIDRLHGLLRRVATRDLAVGDHVVDGVLRLRVPVAAWGDLVGLASDELRHWGAASPRVLQRLEAMLTDLWALVDEDRRDVLEQQLGLVHARRDELPAGEWAAATGPGDPAERMTAMLTPAGPGDV